NNALPRRRCEFLAEALGQQSEVFRHRGGARRNVHIVSIKTRRKLVWDLYQPAGKARVGIERIDSVRLIQILLPHECIRGRVITQLKITKEIFALARATKGHGAHLVTLPKAPFETTARTISSVCREHSCHRNIRPRSLARRQRSCRKFSSTSTLPIASTSESTVGVCTMSA